jgi:hypothetical protein
VSDISDMTNGKTAAEEGGNAKKGYSVNVQVKAHSSTSCSFCWFVTSMYPALGGMTERDAETFRAHLQKAHGLRDEIRP